MIDLKHGDCLELMKEIPDGSVDMVLTSPPYDNLRSYENSLDWDFEIFKNVASEIYRIIKNGGVVVWVVSDATVNGSETLTSFKQAIYFKDIGFNVHDTMIWEKSTFSATGALKVRYAPVFEYMFILTKGKLSTFNPIKDRKNKHFGVSHHGTVRKRNGSTAAVSGASNGKVINKYGQRFNVWKINEEKVLNKLHPAVMPVPLAVDHILSWSNSFDVVLDPFMGSGSTGVACVNTNRKFIGIEKVDKYFEIADKRIKDAQCSKT